MGKYPKKMMKDRFFVPTFAFTHKEKHYEHL